MPIQHSHESTCIQDNDKKSWTVRQVNTDTIEMVKEAAGSEGMKLGAWVDAQLRQAAVAKLQNGGHSLAENLAQVSSEVEAEILRTQQKKFEELNEGLNRVIQGQHSLFTLVASMIEKNSDLRVS